MINFHLITIEIKGNKLYNFQHVEIKHINERI